VAPVDQDGQFHPAWPSQVEEGVDGGPDRPAREEDVVDDKDDTVLDGKGVWVNRVQSSR
jgi:hypothetical protein